MRGVASVFALLARRRRLEVLVRPLRKRRGASPLAYAAPCVVVGPPMTRGRFAPARRAADASRMVYHGRGHFPFSWSEALAALVFSAGGLIVIA